MGARRQFSPEFKREAVQLLESGNRPASELARELCIAREQNFLSDLVSCIASRFPLLPV